MTTAVASKQKLGLGDKLMKWVIIDPQVKEINGKRKIKLFSEVNLLGKILNVFVGIVSKVVDIETLLMVLMRLRESLKSSNEPYFKQAIDAFECS